VCGPTGLELVVAAVSALEAAEVDAVETSKDPARLRREVGVVGGTPRLVELHPPCLAARVDEARQKAWTAHADLSAGEIAGDHCEPVLLADPLFVPCEAERGEHADDREGCRDEPHRQRIGTNPDGLDPGRSRLPWSAAGYGSDDSHL
jgi:hypothetical protein